MYKCNFISWLGFNICIHLANFSDIAESTFLFFKECLDDKESEKIFKSIFSLDKFMIILENSFLKNKLKDQENSICLKLILDPKLSFFLKNSFRQKIPKESVRVSISLLHGNCPVANLIIECTRTQFQELCQQVKEEKAKRLQLAREEKASKQKQQEAQALGN